MKCLRAAIRAQHQASCLERLILFGETSLRTAVRNFVVRYHSERNQQGLDNRLIQPDPDHLEIQVRFSVGNVWVVC
jgi:hypothetical protein